MLLQNQIQSCVFEQQKHTALATSCDSWYFDKCEVCKSESKARCIQVHLSKNSYPKSLSENYFRISEKLHQLELLKSAMAELLSRIVSISGLADNRKL